MLENVDIIGYISKEAMILIPVLYVLGVFLKGIPKIPDWVIPGSILLIGIAISFLMFGVTVDAGIQGVLAAGASVFANQLYKQSFQKNTKDEPVYLGYENALKTQAIINQTEDEVHNLDRADNRFTQIKEETKPIAEEDLIG